MNNSPLLKEAASWDFLTYTTWYPDMQRIGTFVIPRVCPPPFVDFGAPLMQPSLKGQSKHWLHLESTSRGLIIHT
jgi:hypothetical protein